MNKQIILIFSILFFSLFLTAGKNLQQNALIFINWQQCQNCMDKKIQAEIDYFNKKNLKSYVVVLDVRERQIKNAEKLVKRNYKNCRVLFDTNSHYSRLYDIKNTSQVAITDNKFELLFLLDDYTNYDIHENDDSEKIKIIQLDFGDDYPLDYFDNIYLPQKKILLINDKTDIKLYFINFNNGKLVDKISYFHLIENYKNNVSPDTYNKINELKLNRSKSIGFINNKNDNGLLLFLLDSIKFQNDKISSLYSYYNYNFEDDALEKIYTQRRYSIYSQNVININDNFYTGVYDNHYYHAYHNTIRDSAAVLINFHNGKPEVIFHLNDFEDITGSIYSYSFLPKLYRIDNQKIIIYNPRNSLLFAFDKKDKSNIIKFNVKGKLLQLFNQMKKVDKFALYEHKKIKIPDKYFSVSALVHKDYFYVLIREKPSKIFLQIYNIKGEFVAEKILNYFVKSKDKLRSVQLVNVSNNSFDFLVDWEKGYLEIYKIDRKYLLQD